MPRFVVVSAIWAAFSLWAAASDRALTLESGTDIVNAWKPGQHLYVKGNLGVSASRLNQLETWLDEHGSNWIVLLVQNANGEQARDAAGTRYSGVEAVEVAANNLVRNQTAFGELTDPRSKQKNGAVFILFLSERYFSYSGGEVHEVRGLSAKNWAGNLDRPAFRAMSGGGRIVDAVQGTVKEVNRRLDRQFAIEMERQQREIEAAKRLQAQAQSVLEQTGTEVDELEAAVAAFVAANANPPGDLARPPIGDLRRQLSEAATKLDLGDNAEAALADATRVRDFVRAHAGALRDYPEAPAKFTDLNAEIAGIVPGNLEWGRERLELAKRELRLAESAHNQAESAYATHLRNAIEAVETAKEEIARAEAEQRRIAAEEARLAAEREKRRKLLNAVAVGLGALAILGLLALAWWLNQQRRGAKVSATNLFESWDRGVREQTNELFTLMDRSATVVGSAANLEERGYTGETRQLSEQIIEDVDELFIMSACVRRVLRDAEKLIQPGNPLHQIYNQFFAERYERAQNRLRDEPIRFRPEEGIEPILRSERGEPERMLGKLEAHEPFELSFGALIDACNQHVTRATENLNTVENAWATISETLEILQTDCDELAARERKLAAAAERDGFFPVPALFDAVLPEIQQLLDQAVDLGATDPVGALDGPAKQARGIISQGLRLVSVILTARKQRLPGMKTKSEKLRDEGVDTQWVVRFLEEYSLEADGIAHSILCEDANRAIGELETKLRKLDERTSKALVLSQSVGEIATEHIDTVRKAVTEARDSLGEKLDLPPGQILVETGLNPDDRLAEAVKQHSAAQVALNRGGVDAAEAALNAAKEQTDEALGLISVSKNALETHDADTKKARTEAERLAKDIAKHAKILKKLQKRYLPPALRQLHEEPSTTVEDNISESEKTLDGAKRSAETAETCFSDGRLIESATCLELERDLHHQVQTLLDEIQQQAEKLERLEGENLHDFQRLEDRADALRLQAKDPRTMEPSVKGFESILADLSAIGEILAGEVADPVENAAVLGQISDELSDLFKRVQSDWKLHEEASRSLAAARSQLASAEDLVRQARTDNVPDSPQTSDLMDEVANLRLGIAKPENQLDKPHQNWHALDADADRIHSAAGRTAAALRDELKRAEDAITAISQAAKKVRQAAGWSGSHGVRILGSPGAGSLERARQQLLGGAYLPALRFAEDARSNAQRAVANAETEVARRIRAEQRRREEARRRALERASRSVMRSSRSRGGFGGGFGGGRVGGGSRMGGSSFSGGSGMGRSGW